MAFSDSSLKRKREHHHNIDHQEKILVSPRIMNASESSEPDHTAYHRQLFANTPIAILAASRCQSGTQCVAMCTAFIILSTITPPGRWTSTELDQCLDAGDRLYRQIMRLQPEPRDGFLYTNQILERFQLVNYDVKLRINNWKSGFVDQSCDPINFPSLRSALYQFFDPRISPETTPSGGLIIVGEFCHAVVASGGHFYLFDSHWCGHFLDRQGYPLTTATVCMVDSVEALAQVFLELILSRVQRVQAKMAVEGDGSSGQRVLMRRYDFDYLQIEEISRLEEASSWNPPALEPLSTVDVDVDDAFKLTEEQFQEALNCCFDDDHQEDIDIYTSASPLPLNPPRTGKRKRPESWCSPNDTTDQIIESPPVTTTNSSSRSNKTRSKWEAALGGGDGKRFN